jgi:hypothetical protein
MIARLRRRLRWLAPVGLIGALGAGPGGLGCGKKASGPDGPAPELTGLAVVPATAEVIIGADIAKLADGPLIERQVDLLMREPLLSERWRDLAESCKIDVRKQVKRMMIALGRPSGAAPGGPAPGTGPVLMVAVGTLPEADLKTCVTKLVGSGGGTLTGKVVLGRTLYLVKDGSSTMYFAYSRPDTVVLSSDEAFIVEALGSGKKATDNPELTEWRKLVNQEAGLWAVGRVDERLRGGLVQLTEGKLSTGPIAFALTADLAEGLKLRFKAVMSDAAHAKDLESYAKSLMGLLTAAAQWKSLGSVVGKLSVTSEGNITQIDAPLSLDDVNRVLWALDAASTPAQNRALPQGAGSGTP